MQEMEHACSKLKRTIWFSATWTGVVLALICFLMSGCALVNLKKDVQEGMESTVLVGQIATGSPKTGVIVVAAYSLKGGEREIAHYTVLHEAGEYELIVFAGKYYVCAFHDLNSNLVYDAGEPAGQFGGPKPVFAQAGGVVLEINFDIAEKGSAIDLPHGFRIGPVESADLLSRQAGALVTFDDERFDADNGVHGFWEPMDFYRKIGGNIYFLKPYDPKKIPVLFIHGAAGTPRGWEPVINRLDRERFQPWLFYYPTGVRLKSMAYLLFWKLFNLQLKYKFDTLYVVAHSMGGLVARSLIMDYYRAAPYIKLFIALATPWGGNRMAEYGANRSPAVIPSWIDMRPDGPFIQSLYRNKMPPGVGFYMFTGHRGSRNPFRSNNDGTITLSSLLDLRSQSEARMNYTFDEDHVSILKSPAVLAQFNTIINSYEKDKAEQANGGGYLTIDFTFDYPLDGSRPRPILILQPEKSEEEATEIHLSPKDSGRRVGPLPVGNYSASLVAAAARADRHHIPVAIVKNHTGRLRFVFKPEGMVYGHVTAMPASEDRPAGMPAEQFLPGSRKATLQTVSLKGAGIERTLDFTAHQKQNPYNRFIESRDFCTENYFHFFGLPAGIYEARITAKGFKPAVMTYTVRPGWPAAVKAVELAPVE